MLPHKEFVFAYENGSLGCGVSALLTLRLFFAGKIREKKVAINLLLWTLAFPLVATASIVGFLHFSVLWALLGTVAVLAIYALAFFYCVGEGVLSAALASEEFYAFAIAERILWICSNDAMNLPKAGKALPTRRTRRTPR
jgi:hypothetical protein